MIVLLLLIIALVLLRIRTSGTLSRVFSIFLLMLIISMWSAVWRCANVKTISILHLKAQQNVGAMNRAQEAYFLEKGKFSDSLNQLGLGFQPQNAQFVYSVRATTDATFQYGTTRSDCRLCRPSFYDWLPPSQGSCFSDFCSKPIHCKSRSYAGVAYTQRVADEITTKSVLCEAKAPGTVQLNPTYHNGIVDCGADAKEFK